MLRPAAHLNPRGGSGLSDSSSKGYVTLIEPDGSKDVYSYNGTKYVGVGDAYAKGATLTKGSGSPTTFTLTEPDGTQTTYTIEGFDGLGHATSVTEASNNPGAATTTTYTLDADARVTQIVAAEAAGVSCATTPATTVGCRTLQFAYAPTTTAAAGSPGDFKDQLQSVSYTSWDPAAAAMANVVVAAYSYDTTGHLVKTWDPRISPALATTYGYTTGSDGTARLATITPPGLATTTLTYDAAHRLATIAHPDPSGQTATSTIAYSSGASDAGPASLTPAAVGMWGQTDAPVAWTAVFPADHVPAATPSSSDWPYASLTYMDVDGREVNTARFGNGSWLFDATQHDAYGDVAWTITPGNLAQVRGLASVTDPAVAATVDPANGSSTDAVAQTLRAALLATNNTYNTTNGAPELITVLGPLHIMTLASGAITEARAYTSNAYDCTAPAPSPCTVPAGGPFRLVTTTVHGAVDRYNNKYDLVTTNIIYDPLATGDGSGWLLHAPSEVSRVMADGTKLNSYSRYNSAGQIIETRLPAGASSNGVGTDARATVTSYYTPTGSGPCVSVALAGLTCSVGPAAQPTSGPPLPVTTTTYNLYDEPLVVSETAGSVTRTTTTGYDNAARKRSVAVTVTPAGSDGTATPAQTFGYDPSTGLPTTTTDSSGATVTTGYDTLGRVHTYTDATGATTTTSYDIDGRPTTVTDPTGSTTSTYDGTSGEHRGLLTAVTDSTAGTFTGSYTDDGQLATQTYPGGLTASYTYDDSGAQTQVSYAKNGTTWLTIGAQRNENGAIVSANNAAGVTTTYSYDNAGRLTSATDNNAGTCVNRAYGYNTDSDRTTLTTQSYTATAGACTGSGTPTVVPHGYDQADRITDTGYSYDDFGRTLTVPSQDAGGQTGVQLGYYTNDLVQSISGTLAGVTTTKTYSLDPTGRVLTESLNGGASSGSSGLSIDAQVSANGSGSQTISSPALTTTHPGDLLVAAVNINPSGGVQQTDTVSGGGLTWTLARKATTTTGDDEIWTATATTTLSAAVITATGTAATDSGQLTVLAFTGATGIGAAVATGASSGAPSATLTTTAAGSIVLGVGNDYSGGTARTIGANQTMVHEDAYAPGGNEYWVQRTTNPIAAANTATTINDTAPTGDTWNLVAVEILAASTGGGGGGGGGTANAISTDASVSANSFGPALTITAGGLTTTHAGDLLVAYANLNSTATGQTLTVSGGGLAWTLAARADASYGDSEIWTAHAAATLSNVSIAATGVLATDGGQLTVVAYTGAAGVGATTTAAGTSSAAQAGIATTAAGSLVVGVGNDYWGPTARTVASGQTMIHEYRDTTDGNDYWAQATTSAVANAGTAITIADPAPTNALWNLAVAEITATVTGGGSGGGGTGSTLTDHYANNFDNPTWTAGSDGSYTRNVAGLDGATDATVSYNPTGNTTTIALQLLDLHGDVVAATSPSATTVSATYTYDEFGNPTSPNGLRYGWLGGKDKAQSGIGDVTLMGVRLYNAATGRFLQTDPIPGGSCNPYDYVCGDPVNRVDLTGKCGNGALSPTEEGCTDLQYGWFDDTPPNAFFPGNDPSLCTVLNNCFGRNSGPDGLTGLVNVLVAHRSLLASVGATVTCLVPGVGWVSCLGVQAIALGVRIQQRGGGLDNPENDVDIVVSASSGGLLGLPASLGEQAMEGYSTLMFLYRFHASLPEIFDEIFGKK
jgi:RHS repeat-associated protein